MRLSNAQKAERFNKVLRVRKSGFAFTTKTGTDIHTRNCDCWRCAERRAEMFMEQTGESVMPAPPTEGQTVYVRPHFRKSPGHMRKKPHSLAAITAAIARIVKAQRPENQRLGNRRFR